MKFEIDTGDKLHIKDADLQSLLLQVYVEGGYTSVEDAVTLFEPTAVRERGKLICARDKTHTRLAGMIILVPPNSPARRLAQSNEAEIHLLGVMPDYRGQGLGRKLVDTAIEQAMQYGYSKLILWTQLPMLAAQKIYESAGFIHVSNFEKGGREFKLYEKNLNK